MLFFFSFRLHYTLAIINLAIHFFSLHVFQSTSIKKKLFLPAQMYLFDPLYCGQDRKNKIKEKQLDSFHIMNKKRLA